jgi:hypothetical protein
MTRPFAMAVCLTWFGPLAAFMAHADDVAKYVTAEEITGVVVEADTGKPIPKAIVAIRFERNNTGHYGGPHCFRSMAVATDAEGRFRFAPWKQGDTRANATYGLVTAYKASYAVPSRDVAVPQSRRSILGIAFSDTITIPKADVRLELKSYAGTDEGRIGELRRLVNQFACRMRAQFDDMVLLTSIREEIASSPIATQKPQEGSYTPLEWIDLAIKHDSSKKLDGAHEKK